VEEKYDLDHQDNHHQRLEDECAPPVEPIDHQVIQFARCSQFVVYQPAIVRFSAAFAIRSAAFSEGSILMMA